MGGAERAILNVAKRLVDEAYDITIITFSATKHFYTIPEGVSLIELELGRSAPTILHTVYNTLLRIQKLRKTILNLQPDVVLSLLPINDVLTSLALFATGIPHVISTRVYPSKYSEQKAVTLLKKILYPRATKIVSVSSGVDSYYNWLHSSKRTVINNIPTDLSQLESSRPDNLLIQGRQYIISMGRFVPEKNFELLVDAFSKVAEEFTNWDLIIIGDGALKPVLEQKAKSLDLSNRIHFPGRLANPFGVMKNADLFVFSSNFEGVPNVLLEAMSCQLPIITTDYFGEPRDIVENEVTGLIVPRDDAEALAVSMQRVMADDTLRQQLTEQGNLFVRNIDSQKIIKQWDTVFREALNTPSEV
jgi:glycosyltransferase involved in cell wall biosynthesis